ncbi:MAG: HIT family protein [Candidatus Thorarchaeota archaeon]|jgi:histidine triad (HIT) family protein
MSDDCLFCKIVKGEIPSSMIFEDDVSMAFMDVFPVNRGHCLLVPKQHYVNLLDIDLDLLGELSKRLAILTRKVYNGMEPSGILNAIANGKGAGQEVFHIHFHVIPREPDDDFATRMVPGTRREMTPREELDELAQTIREAEPKFGDIT